MPDGLERSYRRLLWACPRFYRRERGLEMLTTLMVASRPGQSRASRGEAADLIRSGLRVRLVPPGWAGKIAAGIVTPWAGVIFSGIGAWALWSLDRTDNARLDDPAIAALGDSIAGRPANVVDLAGSDPLGLAYSYKSRGEFQTLATEAGTGRTAIAGSVLGLIVAWPMMTWLAHRIARTPRRQRTTVPLIGLPVLYACVANTVDTALSMTPDPGNDTRMLTADLMYPLADLAANPLAAIVVAVGLAAAVRVLAPRMVRGAS